MIEKCGSLLCRDLFSVWFLLSLLPTTTKSAPVLGGPEKLGRAPAEMGSARAMAIRMTSLLCLNTKAKVAIARECSVRAQKVHTAQTASSCRPGWSWDEGGLTFRSGPTNINWPPSVRDRRMSSWERKAGKMWVTSGSLCCFRLCQKLGWKQPSLVEEAGEDS